MVAHTMPGRYRLHDTEENGTWASRAPDMDVLIQKKGVPGAMAYVFDAEYTIADVKNAIITRAYCKQANGQKLATSPSKDFLAEEREKMELSFNGVVLEDETRKLKECEVKAGATLQF